MRSRGVAHAGGVVLCAALALLVMVLTAVAAGPGGKSPRITVMVSIPPLAWFADRIGGDRVRTLVLVPPGRDPHTFEPSPSVLARLGKGRVLFTVAAPFDRRLAAKVKATFGNVRVIDCSRGIKRRTMGGDAPGAGEPDPHLWLDPVRAKTIAKNVYEGLVRVDPSGEPAFRRNLKAVQKDLERLNGRIAKKLAPYKGRAILVFHPAFGYFTSRYDIGQIAVEAGGKEPTARRLARLVDRARRDGIKVIFVEPGFSPRRAASLASMIHADVVSIDPLAYDYLSNLGDIADKMAKALAGTKKR